MKIFGSAVFGVMLFSAVSFAQSTFDVSGTQIPITLLRENYGSVPKGIGAYDLNICNISEARQSIVSSKIYQALTNSNTGIQPIGRDAMLAATLRNQNRSVMNVVSVVLSSTTGVLSILGSSGYKLPGSFMAASAFGSLAGQQVLNSLKPVLSTTQLEKFESQVLEPALVLDSGSCVERTVFVSASDAKAKPQPFSFHVR